MGDWRELRVLLVGCGSIGRRHARVLRSLGVRSIAACDSVEGQLEALARETEVTERYLSYDAALRSSPDVVFILTPPHLHVPMAISAIDAGAHVFVEKPAADTLQALDRLAAHVAGSTRKLMVGMCFRFHEGLRRAKRYLEEGRIGRLLGIRAYLGEHLPSVRPDYQNLDTIHGIGVFDLIHEIDMAVWVAGSSSTTVKSMATNTGALGIAAPDYAEILVGFGSGCVASIHLNWVQQPRTRELHLIGSEGTVRVEFADWNQTVIGMWTQETRRWAYEVIPTHRDDMFREEDATFLRAVAEGTPVPLGLEEARKSMAILDEAIKGAAVTPR